MGGRGSQRRRAKRDRWRDEEEASRTQATRHNQPGAGQHPSGGAIALAGAAIALVASLLAPFLVLRPNRLADGVGHGALSLGGPHLLLFLLPLLVLAVTLQRRRGREWALAALGGLMVLAVFLLAGTGARQLLAPGGEFARVSVGAAGWLSLAGAGLVLAAAGLELRAAPPLQRVVALAAGPLAALAFLLVGGLGGLSVMQEYQVQAGVFAAELGRHVALAGGALALATLIGLPLGVLGARRPRLGDAVLGAAGLLQTIPSLALLGLLIAPFSALARAFPLLADLGIRGIGAAPAVAALTLYGLLPVLRGTVIGLRSVDESALDSGRGMGMTGMQLFLRVQAPLALPLALDGLRVAAVQLVGLAAVASLIGAGGLGFFIFAGLGSAAEDLVLLGAIPVLALALLTDTLFRLLERAVIPHGLRLTTGGEAA